MPGMKFRSQLRGGMIGPGTGGFDLESSLVELPVACLRYDMITLFGQTLTLG